MILKHLTQKEYMEKYSKKDSNCPCDHWWFEDCETCRGACSCHWHQNEESLDIEALSDQIRYNMQCQANPQYWSKLCNGSALNSDSYKSSFDTNFIKGEIS